MPKTAPSLTRDYVADQIYGLPYADCPPEIRDAVDAELANPGSYGGIPYRPYSRKDSLALLLTGKLYQTLRGEELGYVDRVAHEETQQPA